MVKNEYGNIDFLRIISAVIVIAIHTDPLQSVNSIIIEKIIRLIYEFAVPFFFITSGFFLERNLGRVFEQRNRESIVLLNVKKLFKYYLIWELIYFPLTVVEFKSYSYPLLVKFVIFAHDFLFTGKFEWSFHLWYLIASIWAVAFIWISFKLRLHSMILDVLAVILFVLATVLQDETGLFNDFNVISVASSIYAKIFGSGGGIVQPNVLPYRSMVLE